MNTFEHVPVMPAECLELLAPAPGMIMVDGTVGLGGHSELILKRIKPGGILIGIDRDREALSMAKRRLTGGFLPIHGNFFDMPAIVASQGIDQVDGILLDLGVSSYQLDDHTRGFSYKGEAPLDMRMDTTQTLTAADIVNTWPEREIATVIREYGEERWAARIAKFICEARARETIATTTQLAEIIKNAIPASARRTGPHPARRTFQALRIAVNTEIDGLMQAIMQAALLLKPGGRICVISFHSLEDRAVKQAFAKLQNPCECPPDSPICTCGKQPVVRILTRHPLVPSEKEAAQNPRARSAKVRAAERI